jgi:hypothetical protein
MAKKTSPDIDAPELEGFAAMLLREVIQADMSMHVAQTDAWLRFAEQCPKGEYINEDIHDGFARNLFLSMSEVKLQWHMKPVEPDLWRRWLKVVFRGKTTLPKEPITWHLTSADDPEAVLVNVTVTRFRDGTVKASYTPADGLTEKLLKTT